MKNKILFTIACLIGSIMTVSAEETTFDFCEQNGVLWTFKIVGYALFIIKIVIPIIIVIMGMLDFSKAVIASDDNQIKKSSISLIKRAIAGLVIFLIPTIINFAFSLVEAVRIENGGGDSSTKDCITCLVDPNSQACPTQDLR